LGSEADQPQRLKREKGISMNVLIDGDIVLYGTVGDSFFGDGFTANDVVMALAEVGRGEDITVRINSGGGIASEGVAIFNALTAHRGRVDVSIDGAAASAASLIAMAGETVRMRKGAVMMIHDPSALTIGNIKEHEKSIEMLDAISASAADIYAEKSGRTIEQVREDMQEEIWLTPDKAVELGYADAIDGQNAAPVMAFDYRLFKHPPERLVAMADAQGWIKAKGNKAELSAAPPRQPETSMATENAAGTANTAELLAREHAAREAEMTSAKREATLSGAIAERERIKAIMACDEAKGRDELASYLAYDTTMSVDDAKKMLGKAPKAATATNRLDVAMNGTNPNVGPDDPNHSVSPGDKPGAAVANMKRLLGVKA
jgi:ATP-dependent Clp protease protease subunit